MTNASLFACADRGGRVERCSHAAWTQRQKVALRVRCPETGWAFNSTSIKNNSEV